MQKIEYVDYLKPNYVNTALIIIYNEEKSIIESATLHSNSFGIITIEKSVCEVHVWETEEHVCNISDLTKRFPTILLNGVSNDGTIKQNIISEVKMLISTKSINQQEKHIIEQLYKLINN